MRLFVKLFILVLFIACTSSIHAQFGLRVKYNSNKFVDWETAINNRFQADEQLLSSGYEVGLDYWFKLKKRRIEFMPEVSYSIANTTYKSQDLDKINFSSFNFNFHTQIYALDMEGDCDCPTFSKQGPSINKGLFFHFTPGISYYQAEGTTTLVTSQSWPENTSEGITFKAGIGVGMDIGVSDLVTVTPMLSYYFASAMNWEKLGVDSQDISANPSQLQFTLRLGFRPDYGRNGRRRR